jgi:UDP-N-acetylmuramyl pentapeptide phosphotransferase/UDP-N-acetylglucosamine-1-phosphate transferase
MLLLMAWMANQKWMADDASSHGISERNSSRLGGISIFVGAAVFLFVSYLVGPDQKLGAWRDVSFGFPPYSWAVLLIALIGALDDLFTHLKAITRLLSVLLIVAVAILSDLQLVNASAFDWAPKFLQVSWIIAIPVTITVAGFINAGNMADGANGLLSGVFLSFACFSYYLEPTVFYWSLILAVSVFLVYNVSSGRIFLGDFGSYGLSALVGFGALDLYSDGGISVWCIASILGYPCLELVRVIICRLSKGQPPLQSSDDHLHNKIYIVFRNWQLSLNAANGATGLSISLVSSGLPALLAITGIIGISDSPAWLAFYLCYCISHLAIYFFAARASERHFGVPGEQTY